MPICLPKSDSVSDARHLRPDEGVVGEVLSTHNDVWRRSAGVRHFTL